MTASMALMWPCLTLKKTMMPRTRMATTPVAMAPPCLGGDLLVVAGLGAVDGVLDGGADAAVGGEAGAEVGVCAGGGVGLEGGDGGDVVGAGLVAVAAHAGDAEGAAVGQVDGGGDGAFDGGVLGRGRGRRAATVMAAAPPRRATAALPETANSRMVDVHHFSPVGRVRCRSGGVSGGGR
jgi:hypothetical protein